MITGNFSSSRMGTEQGRRENPLPWPLPRGIGIFARKGFRDMGFAEATSQVIRMGFLRLGQVLLECAFERARQGYHTVFRPFAIVDGNGALAKVDIFDPEA